MMCEVPSNALLAEQFLKVSNGFSIGSNDMTQLTLGVDRDSGGPIASTRSNSANPAVKVMLHLAISRLPQAHQYLGISAAKAPSDHPRFCQWLVEEGIDTDVAQSRHRD